MSTRLSRKDRIDRHIQFLEWLRDHPEVPLPMGTGQYGAALVFDFEVNNPYSDAAIETADTDIGMKDVIAQVARTLGQVEKDYEGADFTITGETPSGVRYRLSTPHRAVCEQVKVGEREVEVPDPGAPRITITEDVYEWQCPEVVIGDDA